MNVAPAAESPTGSSLASQSSVNEVSLPLWQHALAEFAPLTTAVCGQEQPVVLKHEDAEPREASRSEEEGDDAAAAAASSGGRWGSGALGIMKDRATLAKNHLGPQLLSMKERTSKR